MPTIKISPVTRIEGHLGIEVTIDVVAGRQQVVDAKSSSATFRGFEMLLIDRDPQDAAHYTQRICGMCSVSQGMASALALESAFGVLPPDNARILRNLVLGAEYIMSHTIHFYHLTILDYINTEGIIDISPWIPRYVTADMVTGTTAKTLFNHYIQALAIRRKAHQMAAIFGARLPMSPTFVPGGFTEVVTSDKTTDFRRLLAEIRQFIGNVYLPDVYTIAGTFRNYFNIGVGCGNLLAYGVFDLDTAGASLMPRGRYTNGVYGGVDPALITEYVRYSWYTAESGTLNPREGVTEPYLDKSGAYSWIKSPRYLDIVHETGPLARMFVGYLAKEPKVTTLVEEFLAGFGVTMDALFSVLGRMAMRALECKFIADSMDRWLDELVAGEPVYNYSAVPEYATGIGLTEAPRGALGHWIDISRRKISRYQVVTPTTWNASPRDDFGQMGPLEQALIGTPVADLEQPIEVLRVIRSFDPCIACAVHVVRAGGAKFWVSV